MVTCKCFDDNNKMDLVNSMKLGHVQKGISSKYELRPNEENRKFLR